MDDPATFTQKKRGCRYVIYNYGVGKQYYEGDGGNTLDEARLQMSKLSRPGLDLHVWEGDSKHPDSKDVD